jgi:hypothetical protein
MYCLEDDIIEKIEPEAHLQGTIQEQMLYNRSTLREITEIAYESKNRYLLLTFKFICHMFYVLI